jgi:hypothetical protein
VEQEQRLRSKGPEAVTAGQLGVSGKCVQRANIYVNLQNREAGGTTDPATYTNLVMQISNVVKNATDPTADSIFR